MHVMHVQGMCIGFPNCYNIFGCIYSSEAHKTHAGTYRLKNYSYHEEACMSGGYGGLTCRAHLNSCCMALGGTAALSRVGRSHST